MNLMSSMAKTLVGSLMARLKTAPAREIGITWYFRQVSPGRTFRTVASMSKVARLIEGTPYCRESSPVISSSLTNPRVTRARPSLIPFCFW
jgi:hypothetical protein